MVLSSHFQILLQYFPNSSNAIFHIALALMLPRLRDKWPRFDSRKG